MTEPSSPTEPEQDASEPLAGPPRWVRVVAVIAAVLLVLFLVLQLTGLGEGHGPGQHGRIDEGVHLTVDAGARR